MNYKTLLSHDITLYFNNFSVKRLQVCKIWDESRVVACVSFSLGRLAATSAPISIPRRDATGSRTNSESQYSDLGYAGSPCSSETPVEALGMELGSGVAVSPKTFYSRNGADDATRQEDTNIQYLQQTLVHEIAFLKV